MGVPLLAINPIPGQEEENAEFLEEMGIAVWLRNGENIEDAIIKITDEKNANRIKENIKKFAKPDSASEICKIIMQGHK